VPQQGRGQLPFGRGNPIFASTFAVLVWLGLWLRDERLRGLIP